MTKKSLVLIALSAMFALTACSDNALIGDKNNSARPESLGKVHVNDLGEEHWEEDPNKQHKLFVVAYDKVNNCQGVLELENGLSLEECYDKKAVRDEMADEPRDYTAEDIKKMFGVEREPVKGVTRMQEVDATEIDENGQVNAVKRTIINWSYHCTKKSEKDFIAGGKFALAKSARAATATGVAPKGLTICKF